MILYIIIPLVIIITIISIIILKNKSSASTDDNNNVINQIKCDDYSILVDGKCKLLEYYKNVYSFSPGEIIPNTTEKSYDNDSNTYWETNYNQWPQPNGINRKTTIITQTEIQPPGEIRQKKINKFKIKFESGPKYSSYPYTNLKVFDGEQEDDSKIIINDNIERNDQVIEKTYDIDNKMLSKVLITLYPGVSKIYDVALIGICDKYRFQNSCVDTCPQEAPRLKGETCNPCLPEQRTLANINGYYCECPYDKPREEDETCKECLPESQINKNGKCIDLKKYNIITYSYPPGVGDNINLKIIDNDPNSYWETSSQDTDTVIDIKLDINSMSAVKNIQKLIVKFEPKSPSTPTLIDMYEGNYYNPNILPFFRTQISKNQNIIEEIISFAQERMNKVRIIFSPGIKKLYKLYLLGSDD